MPPTYKGFPSRADVRGNVNGGLREHAFILSTTHTQWTTPAWGGTRDLVIDLDLGAATQTLTLSPSTTYDLNTLVADINTLFSGVGIVALPFKAGRLLLKSPTSGIESRIEITSSDQDVLDLFAFGALYAQGRTLENTPPNSGVEGNPYSAVLVGQGEQNVTDVLNRASMHFATVSDKLAAHLAEDRVRPHTQALHHSLTRTMHQLGAPVRLDLTNVSVVPTVGETVTGGSSGRTGVVANYTDGVLLVAPPPGGFTGSFLATESLSGTVSGAGFADVSEVTEDTRIGAVKVNADLFAGHFSLFGTSTPSPEQYSLLFSLTTKGANGETLPLLNSSSDVSLGTGPAQDMGAGLVPSVYGQRPLVRAICLDEPDDPYSPSNKYDHLGIERQASVGVTSWTSNRIYPSTFSTRVQEGDVILLSNSVSGGVNINSGHYRIVEVDSDEECYVIGPAMAGPVGSVEDTREDAEIYTQNDTAGVTIEVYSPSYLLSIGREDSSGDDTDPWLLLATPVAPSSTNTYEITYCVVETPWTRRAGTPVFPSPHAKTTLARIERLERTLKTAPHGAFAQGFLREDSGALDTGTYEGRIEVHAFQPPLADIDSERGERHIGAAHDVSLLPAKSSETAWQQAAGQVMAEVGLDVESGVGETRPVHNLTDRPTRMGVAVFTYSAASTTPDEFALLTGSTSGALLRFLGLQPALGGSRLLAYVEEGSAVPVLGETFTFNGGAQNITNMVLDKIVGGRILLPRRPTSTLSGTAGSDTLSYTGSVPHIENVRSGDRLLGLPGWVGLEFRPRIHQRSELSPTLTLQADLWANLSWADEWAVTPDLGAVNEASFTDGASVVAGSRFVSLQSASPIPDIEALGICAGDEIFITGGTSSSYVRIASVTKSPTTGGRYLLLIDPAQLHLLTSASNAAWKIRTRRHRTQSQPEAYSTYRRADTRNYDLHGQHERWLFSGAGYVFFPATSYTGAHRGGPTGATIAGLSVSGLSGKTLTIALMRGGQEIAGGAITYATNPATVADVQSTTQSLLTAAGIDWARCRLAIGRTGLLIESVGLPAYTDPDLPAWCGYGSGVRVVLGGTAYEALALGSPAVERGNTSRLIYAHGSSDETCVVLFSDKADLQPHASQPVDFVCDGLLTMLVERAVQESGTHLLSRTMPRADSLRLGGAGQRGEYIGTDQPTLALQARDDSPVQGRGETALSVMAGGEEWASLSHGGELAVRRTKKKIVRDMGGERGTDFWGKRGERPPLLYTGPIHIGAGASTNAKLSFDGHVITLRVGCKDPTLGQDWVRRVRVELSGSTVPGIAANIQAALNSASLTWVLCGVDASGLGLVFWIDESALTTDDHPFYHDRTFLYIDPTETTLTDLFVQSQTWMRAVERVLGLYQNGTPAQNTLAEGFDSLTSGAYVGGYTEGIEETHAAGRRLVSAAGANKDGLSGNTHALQRTQVWEEVAGTLKGLLGDGGADTTTSAETGRGYGHEEALIFMGGTAYEEQDVFLFTDPASGTLQEGERITYTIPGGIPTHAAYITDIKHNQYYDEFLSRGDGYPVFRLLGATAKIRLVTVSNGHGLHAGGSRISGVTSGARAFVNPVFVRPGIEANIPSWAVGNDIRSVGGSPVYAKWGMQVTNGGEKWYLLYDVAGRTENAAVSVSMDAIVQQGALGNIGRYVTSSTHGSYQGEILEAVQLRSHRMGRGGVRPVMALATRNSNKNESSEVSRPAVHSFGDMTVPHGGEFVWRDTIPTNWGRRQVTPTRLVLNVTSGTLTAYDILTTDPAPTGGTFLTKRATTIAELSSGVWAVQQFQGAPFVPGDTLIADGSSAEATVLEATTYDSVLAAADIAPQGRAFTTELLAESGRKIDDFYGGATDLPRIGNGQHNLPRLIINTTGAAAPTLTAPLLLAENSGASAATGSTHNVVWRAKATSFPGEMVNKQHYAVATFHLPVPDGLVWVEGFGAYLRHHRHAKGTRFPAVVALYAVGGQSKEGVIPFHVAPNHGSLTTGGDYKSDGLIHRLDVCDTKGEMIRVDSAGAGSAGIVLDEAQIPAWAKQPAGDIRWSPFRPFPLMPYSERMVELYVESTEMANVPIVGSPIYAGKTGSEQHPAPYARAGTIVYVERYGTAQTSAGPVYTEATLGYRLFVHLGPSSGPAFGANERGYPLNPNWASLPNALPQVPIEHSPANVHLYPWSLFVPGEGVRWTSELGDDGVGVVRFIQRYPHGMNLRVKVYLLASQEEETDFEDELAGVYVRYRTDRVNLSRV